MINIFLFQIYKNTAFSTVRCPNFGVSLYSHAQPILNFAQNLGVGLYSKVGLYSRQYGTSFFRLLHYFNVVSQRQCWWLWLVCEMTSSSVVQKSNQPYKKACLLPQCTSLQHYVRNESFYIKCSWPHFHHWYNQNGQS